MGQDMAQVLSYGTGQDICPQGTRLTRTPSFGGGKQEKSEKTPAQGMIPGMIAECCH